MEKKTGLVDKTKTPVLVDRELCLFGIFLSLLKRACNGYISACNCMHPVFPPVCHTLAIIHLILVTGQVCSLTHIFLSLYLRSNFNCNKKIAVDQYFGLGPSSESIEFGALYLVSIYSLKNLKEQTKGLILKVERE